MGVISLISTVLLHRAYSNTARQVKNKIATMRLDAVRKSITEDKSAPKKNLDTEVLKKANKVAENEARYLAIYYDNALFFFIYLLLTTYVFSTWSGAYQYGTSVTLTAALVFLFST